MNVNYETLESAIYDGSFSQDLEQELLIGFRQLQIDGERLPPASHYAAQIAEIVNRGATEPLAPELAFNLYQEILLACERARATVLGEA
jgi:hypothetical protein